MTTEKHDPWALLAEIHELQPWLSQDADLAARVEAALAGRAEGSTEDVVEWKERQNIYIHDDGVKRLRVYPWGDEWHWNTVIDYEADGTAPTEAEAKSAAIAAARGMK
jgi:hypothetical protein